MQAAQHGGWPLTVRLSAAYCALTVQSALMSTRYNRDDSRAEARRRARLAARGELPEDEVEVEEVERPARGGFLTSLFPPAPPLPNRPDPLAGFDPAGPLRPVRERLFLLRRNPAAWVLTGVLAFAGYQASAIYSTDIPGLIGNFVLFGSLIAAGWFGWQRPALFGTAAALLGFVLSTIWILIQFAMRGAGPDAFGTTGDVLASIALTAVYQGALGFLGGWYGGYLRRRQTQLSGQARRRR